jgi:hypothetical protein
MFTFRFLRRALAAVVVAAGGGFLTGLELGAWHVETSSPAVVVIVAIALLGAFEGVEAAVAEFREARLRSLREPILHHLIAAQLELDAMPNLSHHTVSVTALLVRRRVMPPFRRFLFVVQRLRMFPVPPTPGITWTYGKGIIGLCWETGNLAVGCTGDPWQQYVGCDKKAWKAAPADVRLRLKFKEFRAIVGKYEGVVAVPIVVDGDVEGCVAIDGRRGQVNFDDLATQEVADVAQSAALAIGNLLRAAHR